MPGFFTSCLALTVALATAARDEALPFAKFAQTFREAHDLGESELNDAGLQKLLDQHYASALLGYFDVRYPATLLGDANKTGELVAAASALVDLQQHWLAWIGPDAETARNVQPAAATVAKWVKGWKTGTLAAVARDVARDHDLFKLLAASDDVTNAAHRLAEFFLVTTADGAATKPQRIVMAPTRAEFIGLASFIGAIDEEAKRFLWVPSLPVWTEFYKKGLEVLAFEYGSASGDIMRGTTMSGRDKNGFLQHVLQKSGETLISHYYGDHALRRDLGGVGTNLVIEVLGENNARGEESMSGRALGPNSQFVAGGNSNGGQLKRENADSRFRDSKGRDHFLVALRTCQRQGTSLARASKSAAPEHTSFVLTEGGARTKPFLISAPFIAEAANSHAIPDDLASDYLEFLRAYRGAFMFWLQTVATRDGTSDPPAMLFARILKALATDGTAEQVYGVPITGAIVTDSLELRFLQWLAENK